LTLLAAAADSDTVGFFVYVTLFEFNSLLSDHESVLVLHVVVFGLAIDFDGSVVLDLTFRVLSNFSILKVEG